MKKAILLLFVSAVVAFAAAEPAPKNPFANRWQPAPIGGAFQMDEFIIWCGSVMNLAWREGKTIRMRKRERPQVLLENGRPTTVFFATTHPDGRIFNTGVPLSP
ncbi:MAG: hypothetical protein WCO56_14215 [Verrucomicrobiota bacterium]